ncbi:hypothetical protein ACSMXM_05425 [Pacificimonas sp. ICDLI1SI03]
MASYAKQAGDDTMKKTAERIQARALRRCGELLEQFDGRGGDQSKSVGADTFAPSRQIAAENAGLSKRQQVTAVRTARIPEPQFEAAVESDSPPSKTALAEMGRKPRPIIDLKGRDPGAFNRSLHFVGDIRDYAKKIGSVDLGLILPGLEPDEADEVRLLITEIDQTHDAIVTRI